MGTCLYSVIDHCCRYRNCNVMGLHHFHIDPCYGYVCTCIYIYMHKFMYGCMYVCLYACMHACMHVCMYVCIYIYIYVFIYIYIYIFVCIYIYLFVYIYIYQCVVSIKYQCLSSTINIVYEKSTMRHRDIALPSMETRIVQPKLKNLSEDVRICRIRVFSEIEAPFIPILQQHHGAHSLIQHDTANGVTISLGLRKNISY